MNYSLSDVIIKNIKSQYPFTKFHNYHKTFILN